LVFLSLSKSSKVLKPFTLNGASLADYFIKGFSGFDIKDLSGVEAFSVFVSVNGIAAVFKKGDSGYDIAKAVLDFVLVLGFLIVIKEFKGP